MTLRARLLLTVGVLLAVALVAAGLLIAGLTRAEIQHAVLLSATTIGFPSMMKGLTWVGEELARKG